MSLPFKVITEPLNPGQSPTESREFASRREVIERFRKAVEDDFRFVLTGNDEAMMAAIGHTPQLVRVEQTKDGIRLPLMKFLNVSSVYRARSSKANKL